MTPLSTRTLRALASIGGATVVVLGLVGLGASADASATRVVVRFDHPGSVHSAATADRYLQGTSPSFRRFAAREGARVRREDAGCQGNSGIYVQAFTRGYAIGDVGACGGYEAVWTNRVRGGAPGGAWRQVFGSQDGWYCPALKRYAVPSALVGTSCYSPSRHQVIAYHQG